MADIQQIGIEVDIVRRTGSRIHRMAEFSPSCSKLAAICAVFSMVVTMTMVMVHLVFRYLMPAALRQQTGHWDSHFAVHLLSILVGPLMAGHALILAMRVLTRWLTVLLTDCTPPLSSNCWSTKHRMILLVVPLLFVVKLTVTVTLYTFTDTAQFAAAVTAFCAFSRSLRRTLRAVEDLTVRKLICGLDKMEDRHLLAQCNYIHDVVHYIVTLTVPVMFAVFAVNLESDDPADLSRLRYLEMAAIQWFIQCAFDLLPLMLILCGNTTRSRNGRLTRFQSLSHRQRSKGAGCGLLSRWAMGLKVEYINMMNGWTATDRCVRHFMWWSTIFIGGYFAFYLFYPQQFLCAVRREHAIFMVDDWMYVRCQ